MSKLLEYFKNDNLAATTWKNKYAFGNEETPDDMHTRLAKEFSKIEDNYRYNVKKKEKYFACLSNIGYNVNYLNSEDIFSLFKDFSYIIPAGSVMSGLGTGMLTSLSNCFVIGSPEDSYSSIMRARHYQTQLMKRRGGVGYDMSKIRPRGAKVNNAAKTSTGVASFMDVNSAVTNEVAQEGRRGALMLSVDIEHPDSLEFIEKKQDLSKVTGANISVKVGDKFINAVMQDKDFLLSYPTDYHFDDSLGKNIPYNTLIHVEEEGKLIGYIKKIKAKELWGKLMHCAWNTAEPGILFTDALKLLAPDGVYPKFRMISTNPCGEIPMGAYDSCRLIHQNLTKYVKNPFLDNAEFDADTFFLHTYLAMRLADDLIDLELESIQNIITKLEKENADKDEILLWQTIYKTTTEGRRAGLGFTGLADMLAMLGYTYDSEEAIAFVDELMYIKTKAELHCQIDMAITRGAFPAFDAELEKKSLWFANISSLYPDLAKKMLKYGRRNISWSTVAPTGTVSLMTKTSSSIEPVFLPIYERKVKCTNSKDRVDFIDEVGEKYTIFVVVHPGLKQWALATQNYTEEELDNFPLKVWKTLFKLSPYNGSTSQEIDWKRRIDMQSVIQKYITHSISSTINLDKDTTEEEIRDLYLYAWNKDLKGITIYRDTCRDGVLTSISKKDNQTNITNREAPKRPKVLPTNFHLVNVNKEQYIILVGLLNDKPYEVFAFKPINKINVESHQGKIVKKGKMHYTYISKELTIEKLQLLNSNIEEKAATLYASMLLRHGVSIKHITKIAKKVNENITSFSSALCRILSLYTKKEEVKGEACPECKGKLVREGGCIHCIECGYSKCL